MADCARLSLAGTGQATSPTRRGRTDSLPRPLRAFSNDSALIRSIPRIDDLDAGDSEILDVALHYGQVVMEGCRGDQTVDGSNLKAARLCCN
jgi:hypothetical protein